jgi:hypothetical protein
MLNSGFYLAADELRRYAQNENNTINTDGLRRQLRRLHQN